MSHTNLTPHRSDYSIRWAEEKDLPAILGLVQQSLGTGSIPRTAEYWSWKHEKNPFGRSPCLVAEADNTLVGLRLFLRWSWRSNGQDVQAVRAVDTATRLDWRGKGIFSRLTLRFLEEMKKDGVSFVFNTPNQLSRPGYLKMGWQDVTRVPVYVRPLRLLRTAASLLGIVSRERTEPPALHGVPEAKEVLEHGKLEALMPQLVQEGRRLHTPRDKEYLRWRYCDIPDFQYHALIQVGGSSGAVIIARPRMRGKLREITLSEILCTPDTRGIRIASSLIGHIAKLSDADYLAACAAPGSSERRVLRYAGFIPFSMSGPHFTVRLLDPGFTPDPTLWSSWRLSIGDLEVF